MPAAGVPYHQQIHASAVAIGDRGCLILGASGSGKSTLALEMIALGAELIADDRVDLMAGGDRLLLSGPERLRGVIEARGVGLIELPAPRESVPCALAVDLDRPAERLPPLRSRDLLGISCAVMFGLDVPGLAPKIMVLLRSGTLRDPDQGVT